jgi:hypothetical protein
MRMRTLVTTLALFFVVGAAPMAMAQSANTRVAEGLSLPKDHQYERYNAASGSYGKVDVSQVPALIQGSNLSLRADDGRLLTVDMSRVDGSIQRALTQGEGVTVITHE